MQNKVTILIIALICLITTSVIIFGPFIVIINGFKLFIEHAYITGLINIFVGLILLKVIKPISTLTNKDLKIF